ncbi:hypothetical protein BKH42_08740 [Helicobacter sp. 13S00482-2]|uniref:recombinase RecT n=1 Tax=Helicobacter sp. 13S00482-2 TaxID=1476200 RepID=UPI000BA6D6D7|nr:recombinase RecT [Helicobacter sp. 13S00482-2]PAF52922.1 hypothetical protein BKH42_08740 [Helicobacter sp. 13S00482-2]
MEKNVVTTKENPIAKILAEESIKKSFNDLLGSSNEAKRFSAILMNIALEPKLIECSPQSIINSALKIAELGLSIAKHLGQAYIVKYRDDAETIIGYKGWLSLIERAGKSVKINPVYSCDKFQMIVNGFDEKINLIPNYEARKDEDDNWVKQNLKGILVSIKDHNTLLVTNQFVPFPKIQKIMGMSASSQSKYSPYQNWAIEMFQAKAIKYVLSKTPINDTIAKAIEVDNKIDKEEVLENIQKNIPKKTFLELETALKAFGLQVRLHQNLAIIVGNTFQKEHLLKDLGFIKNQKGEWVSEVVFDEAENKIALEEDKIQEPKTQEELFKSLDFLGLQSEINKNSKNETWIKISAGNTDGLEKILKQMGFALYKNTYVKNITHLANEDLNTSIQEEANAVF